MNHNPAILLLGATLLSLQACSKNDAPAPTSPAASTTPAASAPAAAAAGIREGGPAPDVSFPLQDGRTVALSSLRGKVVAVYFYPKDNTPGCTVEAQGIRDRWADLQQAGVEVIGVSGQDAESHKAFIAQEKLPFSLAVDADGKIARAFEVPMTMGFAARHTILIGKDGKIAKLWRQVKPQGHADEILTAAKAL